MTLSPGARPLTGFAALCIVLTSLIGAAASAQARDLPQFADLVEELTPAVVSITTVQSAQPRSSQRGPQGSEQFDDFFRRFFPPEGGSGQFPAPQSLGSGFIISADGYVLTNNHVIDGAEEIIVHLWDRRELTAEVVGTDARSDLALLKVDAKGLPKVRIGSSEKLRVGEWVMAIGSPFRFDYSVTAGIVSAKERSLPDQENQSYVPFIQTDVAINPGNSGGPLFNMDGEVIGINSQIYTRSGGFMGLSFAIPIDVAVDVADQLKEGGEVSRGWLGVVIQEVSRDLAEGFGLDRPQGALVVRVFTGGPADKAGLKEGDIITAFDGKTIGLSSELPAMVGRLRAGSDAVLSVVREGKSIKLDVQVGELAGGSGQVTQSSSGSASANLIGLTVGPLPEAAQERFDVDAGVQVTAVTGPAAAAGIRPGDIITLLNNRQVSDVEQFTQIVESLPRGRSVAVLVVRGGNATFIPLRVPDN